MKQFPRHPREVFHSNLPVLFCFCLWGDLHQHLLMEIRLAEGVWGCPLSPSFPLPNCGQSINCLAIKRPHYTRSCSVSHRWSRAGERGEFGLELSEVKWNRSLAWVWQDATTMHSHLCFCVSSVALSHGACVSQQIKPAEKGTHKYTNKREGRQGRGGRGCWRRFWI